MADQRQQPNPGEPQPSQPGISHPVPDRDARSQQPSQPQPYCPQGAAPQPPRPGVPSQTVGPQPGTFPQPQPGMPPQPPQGVAPQSSQPGGYPPPAGSFWPQAQQTASANQPVRHHVHHSYIWLGSLSTAFMMLAIMFFSGFSAIVGVLSDGESLSGDDFPALMIVIGIVVFVFVAVVGLTAAYQVVAYKHLYYELGSEEFNLYRGIFNKKRVHVPYQRIQSVDQRATLLQRIFGVCTVNIDTAGGAANKAVTVPYVQKTQAEELRRELFARKQYQVAVQSGTATVPTAAGISMAGTQQPATMPGSAPRAQGNVLDAPAEIWQDVRGVFGGGAVDTGRVTFEYGMSNKELVFTGLSNNTAFVVVILGIVGAVTQFAGQMAPLLFGSLDPVVGNVTSIGVQLFGGNVIAAGVAAFVIAAIVIWAFSAVGTCVSYGGFRACRRSNRIEVEHGLLQHRFHGVDVDRVQSVVVKQSFVRRLLGYCELSLGKIDAVEEGQDQQNGLSQQGLVIHPFVKLSRVPEILAGIIPEFADVPTDNTPVAPVALRRAVIRRGIVQGSGFWLAVIVAVAQIVVNAVSDPSLPDEALMLSYVNMGAVIGYALCLVLLVLDVVGAVLWFRGSGFAYNRRFMQVSNGGFSRETISFPRRKIQFGYTKTNPFQRRAQTATINARTAAGVGGTTIKLIDAREEDAAAWLGWVKPRGNMVE